MKEKNTNKNEKVKRLQSKIGKGKFVKTKDKRKTSEERHKEVRNKSRKRKEHILLL